MCFVVQQNVIFFFLLKKKKKKSVEFSAKFQRYFLPRAFSVFPVKLFDNMGILLRVLYGSLIFKDIDLKKSLLTCYSVVLLPETVHGFLVFLVLFFCFVLWFLFCFCFFFFSFCNYVKSAHVPHTHSCAVKANLSVHFSVTLCLGVPEIEILCSHTRVYFSLSHTHAHTHLRTREYTAKALQQAFS